jgi:N-acetylneuraminic acid mutarotase
MASCLYSNGSILLTGGCIYSSYKSSASRNSYLLEIRNNIVQCKQFKPMLVRRFSHGSVVIKDTAYVFGGHDGTETLSSMEYYDNIEEKWKFLQFMNIEREIFAFCGFRERYIFVFGGFNVNHLDTIERYDVISDTWKLMGIKMKRPMQNPTAVELDYDRVALIGGYNGALHKCIDILDVNKKTWTSIENMQVPRRRAHCYLYDNKVCLNNKSYFIIYLFN